MEESEAVDLITTLFPFTVTVAIIAVGVIFLTQQFHKYLHRQHLAQEALKHEHQRMLLKTSIQAQEDERKRMAQDLHDELGAMLSMGRAQLLHAERQAPIAPQQLKQVRELVENALASTRRISHALMPLQLSNLGLGPALVGLGQQAEKTGSIVVNVAVADNLGSLGEPLELALYRMYAELINNTIKHAAATSIDISVLRKADQLFCRYADDGKGLPTEYKNKGLGLKSLEGRVAAFNGQLSLGNQEEGGFYATLHFVLNEEKDPKT